MRARFLMGPLALALWVLAPTLYVTSASAADARERLGELEEPGQVERRPTENSAATSDPDKPQDSDQEESIDPREATTILPDSEAVDEPIKEDEEGEKPLVKKEEEPEAPSSSKPAPSDPQWSIRWQNAFIVERVDDPRYQFLFGGRIQNDWGVYEPDNDLENAFGGNGTGAKFRRARLYFQGHIVVAASTSAA